MGDSSPPPARARLKRGPHLAQISLSGALCMIYFGCVNAPVTTDLFRHLGATEFHFGLLNGLPMSMLVLQFVGAHWTNRMARRRPAFITLLIAARALHLLIGLLPLLPGLAPHRAIAWMLVLLALNSGLSQLTLPMWLSWMGDFVPRRILSRFWGRRQRTMTLTLTAASLAVTVIARYATDVPLPWLFAGLCVVGATAGIVDISLFRNLPEPPNVQSRAPIRDGLREPLRDPGHRAIIALATALSGSSMLASPFMTLYMLEVMRVPLWLTSLIWCTPGIGAALVAPLWGRLADRFGSRPILRLCVALKPAIALVFLLITPATAAPVLAVALGLDNMLNSGIEIANNRYLLRLVPRANRSMYIVTLTALAGLAAASGAIVGGGFLALTSGWQADVFGRTWNHYQLMFLLSFLLRITCFPLAGRIREPTSGRSRDVIIHLLEALPFDPFALPFSRGRNGRG